MARNGWRVMWMCLAAQIVAMPGVSQDYSLMWPSNVTMTECESATRCDAQWTFRGMKGIGVALSGAQFTLTVIATGPKDFVIDRKDAKGPTVGLTARYTGHVTGDVVAGNVDWTWPGHWNNGTAHGHWFAGLNDTDLREALNRYKNQGARGGSGSDWAGKASRTPAGVATDRFPPEGRTIIPTEPTSTLSLAVDATGNALVASLQGKRIVRIDSAGHALTVAGGGKEGVSTDETQSVAATAFGFFAGPSGIGVDGANNVYTADFREMRKLSLKSGRIANFPVPVHQVASVLGVDAAGDVYFWDTEGVHKYSAREQSTGSIAPGVSLQTGFSEIAGRFAVSQSGVVFFVDQGQLKEARGATVRLIRGSGASASQLSSLDSAIGFTASTDGDLYFVNEDKLWKLQHDTESLSLVSKVPESCPAIQLSAGKPGVLYAFCTGYVQKVALP